MAEGLHLLQGARAQAALVEQSLGLAGGHSRPEESSGPSPDLRTRCLAELAEFGIDGAEGEELLAFVFATGRRARTLGRFKRDLGKQTARLLRPATLREMHKAAQPATTSPLQTHEWKKVYTANVFTLAKEGHPCPYCSTRQDTWCVGCGQCRQCATRLNLPCRGKTAWDAQLEVVERETYRTGLLSDMASALGQIKPEWQKTAEATGYDISYSRAGDDRRRLVPPVRLGP